MTVLETIQYMGERLQIAMIIGSVPSEEDSGEIRIVYANSPASYLFGYPTQKEMEGLDIRSLMPPNISESHSKTVEAYMEKAKAGAAIRQTSIMGRWRCLEGIRKDGSTIPVRGNVADIKNSEERYFLALFIDRREEVEKETALQEAIDSSKAAMQKLEAEKEQSEKLREKAEKSLLKEKKLTGQMTLLRQIFGGTVGLVAMLGALIIASWLTGHEDSKDALAMIERVLLVLTGILGSAMASVFDSRSKADNN